MIRTSQFDPFLGSKRTKREQFWQKLTDCLAKMSFGKDKGPEIDNDFRALDGSGGGT